MNIYINSFQSLGSLKIHLSLVPSHRSLQALGSVETINLESPGNVELS